MTNRTPFIRIIRYFILVVFFVTGFLWPYPKGWAQNSGQTMGLRVGNQDTMRLDLRVKGSEEKDIDSSISDHKIGAVQKSIRTERKEKEQLRAEEEVLKRKNRAAHIERMNARIEMQKREAERIRQKKTKIIRSVN